MTDNRWSDPRLSTTAVLIAVAVAGLVLHYLGWRGVAAALAVPLQLPYLVSGAIGGIACTATALVLLLVHLDRSEAATERRQTATLQREVLRLLAQVREQER